MTNHYDTYSEEEQKLAQRFFTVLLGVLILIGFFFKKDVPPDPSNYVLINGTLITDVNINTGRKARYNYFSFQLKEDIYKNARFEANSIFFVIDRQRIRTTMKTDSIVSFYVSKEKFDECFLVQDNDIYGPNKLGNCRLEPITIAVNNRDIFSFEDYLEDQRYSINKYKY